MTHWFAIGTSIVVGACGVHSTPSVFSPDLDAAGQDGGLPPADGPFPCGPQPGLTCAATQYCLLGCTDEGPVSCGALLDSGVCPANYTLAPGACDYDGAPCEANGEVWPTVCLDDPAAATCPGAGVDPSAPTRTVTCACSL